MLLLDLRAVWADVNFVDCCVVYTNWASWRPWHECYMSDSIELCWPLRGRGTVHQQTSPYMIKSKEKNHPTYIEVYYNNIKVSTESREIISYLCVLPLGTKDIICSCEINFYEYVLLEGFFLQQRENMFV